MVDVGNEITYICDRQPWGCLIFWWWDWRIYVLASNPATKWKHEPTKECFTNTKAHEGILWYIAGYTNNGDKTGSIE